MDGEKWFWKIQELEAENNEMQKKLEMSAYYGKNLLEKNEHEKKQNESLEQEIHSLRNQLEIGKKMYDSLNDENENLRSAQSYKIEQEIGKVEAKCFKISIKDKEKIKALETELEAEKIARIEAQKIFLQLEQQLETANRKLENLAAPVQSDLNVSEDSGISREEMDEMKNNMDKLEQELSDLKRKLKYKMDIEEIQNAQIQSLEAQLESKEMEISSYMNIIEKQKSDLMNAKLELESQVIAEINPDKKGNSLFSEVDDRRKKLEYRIEVLKAELEKLRRQNTHLRTEVNSHKIKISQLLSMMNSKNDTTYREHLEVSLKEAQNEIQRLHTEAANKKAYENNFDLNKLSTDDKDPDNNYRYLYVMLKDAREQVEKLQEDLKMEKMQRWQENEILTDTKKQLVWANDNITELQGKIIQLQASVEEDNLKQNISLKENFMIEPSINRGRVLEKLPPSETKKVPAVIPKRGPSSYPQGRKDDDRCQQQ